MALGYDGKLYILAFDHRGSFQKKMFGIEGDPTPEETATITDAKQLDLRGHGERGRARASTRPRPACSSTSSSAATCPSSRASTASSSAMPVEKSGQDEFDFQYGDDFGEHILKFDPHVLQGARPLQPGRRRRDERAPARPAQAARRLAARQRPQVPVRAARAGRATAQLEAVGGDTDRYDAELRPELMRRSIENIQNFGIEVDIWKIEGVDAREDARDAVRADAQGRGPRERRVACCSAAARATRRSTTGSSRPPPSRASSASRSAARSGGTR